MSFATRVTRYDAGAPDEQSVTPHCLRKAFRDLFAVDLDASEARLDLTLCVVGSGDDAREDWASGEVGGFETYLIAEEDDDPEVRALRRRRLARHTPRAAPDRS